tara:strand:- start:43756 stop:44268 length:513 start_codon:yes stop_codon:yes gene_type:complete
MVDHENLDNIGACDLCGYFHPADFNCMSDMDDQPFCEQHPDIRPTVVRGVEGDDVAYECSACIKDMGPLCKVHPNVEMLAIPNREGIAILKHVCPCCAHTDALKEELAEQVCADMVETAKKGYCPYHPDQPMTYIPNGMGEPQPECQVCIGDLCPICGLSNCRCQYDCVK